MARPQKIGLEYFPLDCQMDDKVEMLEAEHGLVGFAVYVKLLQHIYQTENGELDMSVVFRWKTLGKQLEMSVETLQAHVETMFAVGLFDRSAFQERQVLTSNGVQKRRGKVAGLRQKDRSRKAEADSEVFPEFSDGKPTENGGKGKGKGKNTTVFQKESTPPTPGVGAQAAPAQDSKKNEAPAAAENYPADDSPASASHTGPAAAGGDTRPEFRADPEWAPEMRVLAAQMIAYWQLSQQQQQQRMALTRFCRVLFDRGQGEYLREQFHAYRAYKELTGERPHGWPAYIGKEADDYDTPDAGWNLKTWATALAEARNNPRYGQQPSAPGAAAPRTGQVSKRLATIELARKLNAEQSAGQAA